MVVVVVGDRSGSSARVAHIGVIPRRSVSPSCKNEEEREGQRVRVYVQARGRQDKRVEVVKGRRSEKMREREREQARSHMRQRSASTRCLGNTWQHPTCRVRVAPAPPRAARRACDPSRYRISHWPPPDCVPSTDPRQRRELNLEYGGTSQRSRFRLLSEPNFRSKVNHP
ncbi:uncharacterized protein LOC116847954 isoform X2 [Odontomachus brunneus]|uniref:uncharacterized protein LOC116847954 isoform X2 n=1 Tax=Odontomachus brunneus TaxID=486640 RepID=UPI0013F1A3C7|nr:uncharacterized protein LOC116847954 isoform X2 [Odontomachus brunneus]